MKGISYLIMKFKSEVMNLQRPALQWPFKLPYPGWKHLWAV